MQRSDTYATHIEMHLWFMANQMEHDINNRPSVLEPALNWICFQDQRENFDAISHTIHTWKETETHFFVCRGSS